MTNPRRHAERLWDYSAFPVAVARVSAPTTNFRRVTLSGSALRHFAPWGLDQRVKLVLPLVGGGFTDVGLRDDPTPHPRDWYARWKALPEELRNPLRTYTPSAIRPQRGEIDIDLFIHEPAGPASQWALTCMPGDEIIVTGPDIRVGYTGYGIHFTPPAPPRRILLIGDASALPAIANIVRAQPAGVQVEVLVELADATDLPQDDLVGRTTIIAEGAVPGASLERLVRQWTDAESTAFRAHGDRGYTWIAGETGAVTRIRRHLMTSAAFTAGQVSFLGYWRHGGPLVG